MKDREIVCRFYTYEGGPCDKRGISAHFRGECQTCAKYDPLKHGRPARPDVRKKKLDKARGKDEGC